MARKNKKRKKKDFIDFSFPKDVSGKEEFGLKEAEIKTKVKRSFSFPIVFLAFFVVFLITILFLLKIFEGLHCATPKNEESLKNTNSQKEGQVVANWQNYTLYSQKITFKYPGRSEITSQEKNLVQNLDFISKERQNINVSIGPLPENFSKILEEELTQIKKTSGQSDLNFVNVTIAGFTGKMLLNFPTESGAHSSKAFFQSSMALFEITSVDKEGTDSSLFLTRTFEKFLQSFKKI